MADPIKPTTPEAIRQLHEENIRVVMLTGDSRTTAAAVARKLGFDDVIAEVLSADKSNQVKRLQEQGAGTDVAMQSGVTLVKRRLAWNRPRAAFEPGHYEKHQTESVLRVPIQRFLGVPIAAGLYPFFGLLLIPMIAAGRDESQLGFRGGERLATAAGTSLIGPTSATGV